MYKIQNSSFCKWCVPKMSQCIQVPIQVSIIDLRIISAVGIHDDMILLH